MIIIKYKGDDTRVIEATGVANALLKNGAFYDEVAKLKKFDLSNATPEKVAEILKNSNFEMEIQLYKSKNPFSKALAYDDPENPFIIHLNKRRLDRSVASICATIIHEIVHAADAICEEFEFGHGDNSSVGKENTAPYAIDNLAYQMVSGDLAKVVFQHDDMSNDLT